MTKEPPSQAIELSIQRLLKSSHSVEDVAELLIREFENETPSRESLESCAIFLLYAGQTVTLNSLLARGAREGWRLPWALFCESLFLSSAAIPASIKTCLIAGAKAQEQLEDLCRSNMLDHFEETLKEMRIHRQDYLRERLKKEREALLQKASMMRGQGLLEQEAEVMGRLARLFPEDEEIKDLRESRQMKASPKGQGFAAADRERWLPLPQYEAVDEITANARMAIEQSMHQWLQANSDQLSDHGQEMRMDFVVAQLMLENFEAALHLLPDQDSLQKRSFWLRLELLLLNRMFAELAEITQQALAADQPSPDATVGLLYFRAQALLGLGDRSAAIEILESLSLRHGDHRDTSSLLRLLKDGQL